MTQLLRQSTTQTIRFGPFLDATDFVTAETALTITQADMQLSKDGAAFAQKNAVGNATHDADGWYSTDLNATDTNTTGILRFQIVVAGALPVWETFLVVPANTYDAFVLGTDTLRADVTQWLGAAVTAGVGGRPAVDAEGISGSTVAADNVEANIANLDATVSSRLAASAAPANFGDLAITVTTGQVTVGTNNDKAGYSISGTVTTLDGLNDVSAADVKTQADAALSDVNLDHFVGTSAAIPAVPAGTYLDQLLDDGVASFDRTTDSLQAIRDRGDTAWITGGGGGITQILNVQPLIPESIDLANTATFRLGLMLTNAVDDLPSTAEITPGTISIDRKAIGATTWSAVVTDAACSEAAGTIFFDEVFDTATGYAEGDSIRITFKSQSITADANTHEITSAAGQIFYTEIRQTMRGTDSAATAAALATVDGNVDAILVDTGTTLPATLGTPAGASVSADVAAVKADTAATLTDTNELQTDWANGGRLDNILDARASQASVDVVDGNVDAILVDTGTTIPGTLGTPAGASVSADIAAAKADTAAILVDTGTSLPATLGTPAGASISADIAALNDVSVADLLQTQMTESYASDGVAPTLEQALFAIQQFLQERAVAGVTMTVNGLDGTTPRMTFTLNDATNPTSITRAT